MILMEWNLDPKFYKFLSSSRDFPLNLETLDFTLLINVDFVKFYWTVELN